MKMNGPLIFYLIFEEKHFSWSALQKDFILAVFVKHRQKIIKTKKGQKVFKLLKLLGLGFLHIWFSFNKLKVLT